MCIKQIVDKMKLGKPKNIEELDHTELYSLLYSEFPEADIYISDRKYKTTSFNEYVRFLQYDQTDKNRYISEYFDCDNFSFLLMGNTNKQGWSSLAFGILWVHTPKGGHAVNLFIDNNRDIWIIEPQNDKIFRRPEDWKGYLVII